MGLTQLEVTNFRSLKQANLHPSRGLNVISGANASGKTSLLEAIHTLGMGRSFRGGGPRQTVRYGTDGLVVHGRCCTESGADVALGVERTLSGWRIKVNGKPCDGARALAEVLPLQAIVPDTRYLFMHNARSRRAIMDWGLFHVEPQFYPLWLRYRRALHQRNSALSDGARALEAWDHELASLGEQVHALRQRYVGNWQPRVVAQASALLADEGLELELRPGWVSHQPLAQALVNDRQRDRAHGYTHAGAHRADLEIRLNGLPLQGGCIAGTAKACDYGAASGAGGAGATAMRAPVSAAARRRRGRARSGTPGTAVGCRRRVRCAGLRHGDGAGRTQYRWLAGLQNVPRGTWTSAPRLGALRLFSAPQDLYIRVQ
ncbi:MAG: DNA replication/repair protein RecF [Acidiferrobacterales bacterium]